LIESKLSPKMEDYLETISFIEEKKEVARVGEIADGLGVKSSSVNVMLKILSGKGLLKHEKYGYIKLTEAGREIAEQVKARHHFLNKFLVKYLGVSPDVAAIDACGLEHSLSKETFTQFKKFVSFLEKDNDHQNINIHKRIEEYSNKK
jgi:DtxR family transcriptional regulator, Mn-dependent transcriptional regulator